MAEIVNKLKQSKILKNILIIIGFTFILIFLTSVYIRIYSHHGQTILTPSFKGLNLNEAIKIADHKGIKLEIIDSVYDAYGAPGTIVDQTPNANFQIKRNRKIFIVIKAFTQKKVKMPNLLDVSLTQAQALLESAGLMVGRISYIPNPGFSHLVMAQKYKGSSIPAGTMVVVGSKIDLSVGEDSNTSSSVPDLTGLTYKEALSEISANYLNVGKVYYNSSIVTARDSAEAVIYKQSPESGYSIQYGANIDIWLSSMD